MESTILFQLNPPIFISDFDSKVYAHSPLILHCNEIFLKETLRSSEIKNKL